MPVIRIGFDAIQKQSVVSDYCIANSIKKVYVIYFKKFKPDEFKVNCEIEYLEWSDIIEYEPFYRLIREVNANSLIVMDECMRTQNRNELTYNCTHHYCNQTPHKIVFEYFPIIDDLQNVMILLDFIDKGKYKGRWYEDYMLEDLDIKSVNRVPGLGVTELELSQDQQESYVREKEKLFDNLGKKHPDTICTSLELFVGRFKKHNIDKSKQYIARNSRLKLENVSTFKDAVIKNLTMVDFPTRQLDLNDYIKRTGTRELTFVSSGLNVDKYYISEYMRFREEANKIYAKTSIQ